MGTNSSHCKPPANKSRPSIHSGKLYKSQTAFLDIQSESLGSQSLRSAHARFTSADFDKSNLELKENLPDDLKVYSNSIEIVYRFWCSEIETLSEDDYKQTAVLFYMNVFKLLPEVRPLFSTNIEKQAQRFFGMFRWLINNLKDPNPERLIKRIKMLGVSHQKMGIKESWYDAMLQGLHDTLCETVKEKYTSRIRFCWEQLYTVVINIMTGQDFESLSSKKIAKLVKSLKRLEDTLNDDEASEYLQLYMKQQFCVELLLFYKDCRRYKACSSDFERFRIGSKMMKKYFGSSAECQINVGYVEIENVNQTLQANHNVFVADLFDECCTECVAMIRSNIWYDFKRSIMRMAVDADIRYDEIQASRSNLQLKLQISTQSELPCLSESTSSPATSPRVYLQVPQFADHCSTSISCSASISTSQSISNLLATVQ